MNYTDLDKYYLCSIAANGKVHDIAVGMYDEERKSFSFKNGAYSPMELFREPRGSSATYIFSATPLQDIEYAGLLNI